MNRVVYKTLRERKSSGAILLIASIAIMTLCSALILIFFGADVKTIPLVNPVYDFLGARITHIQVVMIMVSSLMLTALWLLMKKTTLGKAMRAVADNKDVAKTVGIDPEVVYTKTFLLGSFLAGIAGILIGIEQNLYPRAFCQWGGHWWPDKRARSGARLIYSRIGGEHRHLVASVGI